MSDRSAATIEIGGEIKNLHSLLEAIASEDVTDDWGGDWDNGPDAEAYIRHQIEAGQTLTLMRAEIAGGYFETLETECREQGLSYCRSDDGHYAYSAEHAAWQPGMAEPIHASGATEEGAAIPLHVLRRHDPATPIGTILEQYSALDAPIPPITLGEGADNIAAD